MAGATRRGSSSSVEEKLSLASSPADQADFPMDLMGGSDGDGDSNDGHTSNKDMSTNENTVVQAHIFDAQDALETGDSVDGSLSPQRCAPCRSCCLNCCRPVMTKYNTLPVQPSTTQRIRYAMLCPPHGKLGRILSLTLMILLIWGSFWGITEEQALPGGNFFGLIIVVVASLVAGACVTLIKLPPLLGMLLMGGLLRNVPVINVAKDIDPIWAANLRSLALVVILIRAGLGLDPAAMRKLSFVVVRLAFLPCIVEGATIAVATNLLLGFPWIWGFMLGFVLAAVTPAVVVPSMLSLQERGFGVDQGIPTLVIAAASIDDVLAISAFGVCLGIAFSTGDLAVTIIRGPGEALLGLVFGCVMGLLCWYLPHRKNSNIVLYRTLLMLTGGLVAMFGSRAAGLPGAGALGCLAMPFVAALRWRQQGWTDDNNPVDDMFAKMWVLCEPLMFGLIGAEVDISKIQPSTIGLGIATLFIGIVPRMIVSSLAVLGMGLNLKEKLFIPLAWLPKATVQAAIGSLALDTARQQLPPDLDKVALGEQILTIAVLCIIITAPLGAAAIALTGPRLLRKSTHRDESAEKTIENNDTVEQEMKV